MATAGTKQMTMSGFCRHPSPGSHQWCQKAELNCDCPCHTTPELYDDGHTIGDIIDDDDDDDDEPE